MQKISLRITIEREATNAAAVMSVQNPLYNESSWFLLAEAKRRTDGKQVTKQASKDGRK